jgi:cold shock CspA family protein
MWNDEPPLRSRIDQGVSDLRKTGLFSSVEFIPLDAEGLKGLYREIHHKIVREIIFEKHTILPQIAGVEEAYIGVVPCTEYLKVICDEDGALNRRLFYDNVRDFQGHNPVNTEIAKTIQDAARNDRFSLLNNGVTIVASDLNKVGARFKLKDFQIVNGCQTSHIIYLNRAQLTSNIYLPVKLIVTTDSEVTSQVIQGTNRQTEVQIEAFESLAPFQKKLEELYLALAPARKEPLYYERRSKQYYNLGIRKERIITLTTQIKGFLAMFLNEPQSTHRYYGELLASYRGRLFSESHSPLPYYVSGLALATLENLFVEGVFPRSWKARKFQLLMVYRLQNEVRELPPLNSKAIESYCDAIIKNLDDQTGYTQSLRKAGELVEEVRTKITEWREPPERTKAFTSALIQAATHKGGQAATTSKEVGIVKWFSDVKGYGFIQQESGEEIFVHYSGIIGDGYRSLTQGQKVSFATVTTSKGNQATEVETIS